MNEAFVWWATVELLGLIALPFALSLFKNLPDRGYAFGKALSILLVSYLLWLAASLHILPNTRWAIVLVVAVLAWASLLMVIRRRREVVAYLRQNRNLIIAVEALFLLSFVLWTVVRAYNPEILWTEKPMDFAFINGIMRSEYFPPLDPWLSGFTLNNYYFGHMMMATLTKLTGIPAAITFNLSVALVFALAAIGAFGLVYNLVKLNRGSGRAAMGFGLVAAGFLLILGNLEGVLEMLHSHGVGGQGFWSWVGITGLDSPYHSEHWYPTDFWWWWRATRMTQTFVGETLVDYTIAEFPVFTFVLGDLHAHLMSLPYVLLFLGFCLNVFMSKVQLGLGWLKRNVGQFIALLICLGALGPLHTWDLPIYLVVFIGAVFIQARLVGQAGWWKGWPVVSLVAVLGSVVLYLPFYLNMDSPISGIAIWREPDTRLFHLLLFWGFFVFVCVSFALAGVRRSVKALSWLWVAIVCGAVLLPWFVWAIAVQVAGGGVAVGVKLWHLVPLLALLAVLLLAIVSRLKAAEARDHSVTFALFLMFVAFLLITGCELFYVSDVFGNRMNTVFRFYYQAWVMLAVGSAFGIHYVYRHMKASTVVRRVAKAGWWAFLVLLIGCSLVYSFAATWSKTDAFSRSPTLDGLAWLDPGHAEELEAINWLNANVTGALVIVESPGNCYTDHSRISASTGLPTVLGWEHHEWVWRGSSEQFAGRRADVDAIYRSEDEDEIMSLLKKYDVTYVYYGRLEEEMYGSEVKYKFTDFMDIVFENEGVVIYRRTGA
ncbi:MAG: DUF2298 domain-containing protein [Chloroflexota bacterium]